MRRLLTFLAFIVISSATTKAEFAGTGKGRVRSYELNGADEYLIEISPGFPSTVQFPGAIEGIDVSGIAV